MVHLFRIFERFITLPMPLAASYALACQGSYLTEPSMCPTPLSRYASIRPIPCHLLFLIVCATLISSISSPLEGQPQKKYTLSVCTVFQDEAPYLAEWIAFHQVVGVEHFFLFDHGSQDDFSTILDSLKQAGIVTVISLDPHLEPRKAQEITYLTGLERFGSTSQWIAFIDVDEFLNPIRAPNLPSLLKHYVSCGGLAVNWQMFGSSNLDHLDPTKPMIEQLTWKAHPNCQENHLVKCLVQPDKTLLKWAGPHKFYYHEPYTTVDPDHQLVTGPIHTRVSMGTLQLNHYWSRDHQFAYTTKIDRRVRWLGWTEEQAREAVDTFLKATADQQDATILRFLQPLKDQLARNHALIKAYP